MTCFNRDASGLVLAKHPEVPRHRSVFPQALCKNSRMEGGAPVWAATPAPRSWLQRPSALKESGFPEEQWIPGPGQGRSKMSLEHLLRENVGKCLQKRERMWQRHRRQLGEAPTGQLWNTLSTKISTNKPLWVGMSKSILTIWRQTDKTSRQMDWRSKGWHCLW